MSDSGFHRLLARLESDPARAVEEFQRLRLALTRFFDWRGASDPDDCADEALGRLATKLEEGVAVLDVPSFTYGIARMVLKETTRAHAREIPLEGLDPPAAPTPDRSDDGDLSRFLEKCLGLLSSDERDLVLAYYAGGDGRNKIERRRELARQWELSDNALRSRVQRLRDRLEACVRSRVPGLGRKRSTR